MGLKKRIIDNLSEIPGSDGAYRNGFEDATESAAQLAAEADELMEEMAAALYDCKQLAVELVRSEGQDPEGEDEIKRACYALDLYRGKTND